MKSQEDFFWKKEGQHRNNSQCKACRKIQLKKYRDTNKDKIAARRKKQYHNNLAAVRAYARQTQYKKYGINIADYNKLAEIQDHKCAICGTQQSELTRRLYVDHCHTTGIVRGLLCGTCNFGLGSFKDNIDYLLKAASYLKNNT